MSTAEEEVRQALIASGFDFRKGKASPSKARAYSEGQVSADATESSGSASSAAASSAASPAESTSSKGAEPAIPSASSPAPSTSAPRRDTHRGDAHRARTVSDGITVTTVHVPQTAPQAAGGQRPRVLAIAGTDPTGGAGILADMKTITACGGYAMGVVTSVVAQNTREVTGIWPQTAQCVEYQLKAVSDDVSIDAVKIGMLGTEEIIDTVHEWLENTDFTRLGGLWRRPGNRANVTQIIGSSALAMPAAGAIPANGAARPVGNTGADDAPVEYADYAEYHGVTHDISTHRRPWTVIDPVMISTSGTRLLSADAEGALRDLLTSGLIDVITPNLPELAALVGEPVATTWEEAIDQGTRLLDKLGGHTRVYVKSGHLKSSTTRADAFIDANTMRTISRNPVVTRLPGSLIATHNTHGTGCALSSALAAYRPQCHDWLQAAHRAKVWITGAIAHSDELNVGLGNGPVNHSWNLTQATPIDDIQLHHVTQREMHGRAALPL